MDFAHFWFQQTGGPAPHHIGNSLRFRGAQHLERHLTAGNSGLWSFSLWFKKAVVKGKFNPLFFAGPGNWASNRIACPDDWAYTLWVDRTGPSASYPRMIAATSYGDANSWKMRDPSAWYHVLTTFDVSLPADDRMKFFINGVETPRSYEYSNRFDNSFDINRNAPHKIGADSSEFFNGHMAEVHFVDGTALAPTSFGEFNADGVWVPIDPGLTQAQYGTNGFYLDFSDPADIGADRSGNGNNFTPTGFELTNTASGVYDSMTDSPTSNFATVSPLLKTYNVAYLKDANLTTQTSGANGFQGFSTIVMPESGRYYYESVYTSGNSTRYPGLMDEDQTEYVRYVADGRLIYQPKGGSAQTTNNWGATWTLNDVIGTDYDCATGRVRFYKNGVEQGTGDPRSYLPSTQWMFTSANYVETVYFNFGQRPFFGQPAGTEPFAAVNLPDVAITNPSDHFRTILDTGANILTNAQSTFPNGLWWIKDRANGNNNQLLSSAQGGASNTMTCPNPNIETAYVAPTGNSVAWCWALPATGVANTAGSINSTVFVNETAGFSTVLYPGNGAGSATVGHGLSQAPEFVIIKNRDNGYNWVVHHQAHGSTGFQFMEEAGGTYNNSNYINGFPTNTVVNIGGAGQVNNGAHDLLMYCWYPVPGYSAFGSYVANNNLDGPFVYTGFRPSLVIAKSMSAYDWLLYDDERLGYNVTQLALFANRNYTEQPVGQTGYGLDLLSNGFKLRTNSNPNQSSHTYIYAAFAEHPFGGGNVSPSPAR